MSGGVFGAKIREESFGVSKRQAFQQVSGVMVWRRIDVADYGLVDVVAPAARPPASFQNSGGFRQ